MMGIRPSWSCIRGPCRPLLLVPGKILGTGSPAVYSPGRMRPQIQRCWLERAVWACWGEAGRGAPVCPSWLGICCWSIPWLSQALMCQPASGAPGLPEAPPGRAGALARWAALPSGLHVHSPGSELGALALKAKPQTPVHRSAAL